MSKCEDLVIRKAQELGLRLPEQHLREVTQELDRQIKGKRILSKSQMQDALDKSVDIVNQRKIVLRQMKLEALLRVTTVNSIMARISAHPKSKADGLIAFLTGESRLDVASRDNLATKQQGLENMLMRDLDLELEVAGDGFKRMLETGQLDAEIYDIAYQLGAGKSLKEIDASPEAKKIHQAIFKVSNSTRERMNRAGAFIGKRDDYITAQSHDMKKIKDAGFKQWRDDFIRLVDEEATLGHLNTQAEKDEYLEELYNRFITGKHYLVDRPTKEGGFRPTSSNITKKISQSRSIHFVDGKSAFEYASKYSEGTIYEKLALGTVKNSRTIALLENLGPNPRAALDAVIEKIEQDALAKGEAVPAHKLKLINDNFDYMNGLHDIPSNVTMAEIGNVFRVLESLSKLGGAVLSAGPDLVFKAATLNRRTDMGVFGSYVKSMTDIIGGLPKADREHASDMFGIYAEVTTGKIFSRFGSTDGMPGRMSRLQEAFFKWNGLQGWTIAHKKGIVAAFSMDLARYRNVDFDALPVNTKRNLEMYSITGDEWNTLRFGQTEAPNGKHFLTPETAYTLPDSAIDSVIAKQTGDINVTDADRASYRDRLAGKIQSMGVDIADEGVVTPGQRERVLMTLGTQKGTVLGEFMRFVGQFKAFPVTVITKQLMPQYYSAGGGPRGFMSLMPIILATTALGYVSGAAKDLAKGREPRDPRDPKTFVDAMTRGGGLGLFGDFMFQEYSKYGRSFQETLLGPGVGTISDFASLAHKSATLNADAKDYFTFIKNITPGQNLFYAEAAINYLFYYGLMEAHDPGYLKRMEKRRAKEYDQDYWLSPAQDSVRLFD